MRTAMPILASQHFAGNALVRGLAGRKLEALLASDQPQEFALVAGRCIGVTGGDASGRSGASSGDGTAFNTAVRWLDRAGLAALDILPAQGECLRLGLAGSGGTTGNAATSGKTAEAGAAGVVAAAGMAGAEAGAAGAVAAVGTAGAAAGGAEGSMPVPVYFLGEDVPRRTLRMAVDVSAASAGWAEQRQVKMQDLRSLMPLLAPAELAVAGHAQALSQWHQAHLFCPRCGAPSSPADGGSRRQCSAHAEHRAYPRTDPVVIMLVESPDGEAALLGRSKKMRAGMLTCLSGFCDQGEGIEEAVRRETREEAGVEVVAVDIVGSQPWPVGRGGSCELMIGCIAQAAGQEITVDPEEMEEVQWVSRADVLQAVRLSELPDSPYLGGKGNEEGRRLGFFVPPPFAIAHHLIKRWAEQSGPWFNNECSGSSRGRGEGEGERAPFGQQAAAAAPSSNL